MTLPPTTADTPQLIGPYRIDTIVSQARAATVYQAHDTLYDRPVLLRVLSTTLAQNTELVRRFISLGRDAARLHHPHLVEVYEAGHADGYNYIAQELLTGGTLATRLQNRHHPYLLYDAIAIIEPLAAALDYAHTQGYVHGSLTAESILFTADHQPKLADIGLLSLETLGTQSSYATNVSPYMSPEQARGEGTVDQRADIYTLGVIAFLMLTGETPFTATNPLALLRKIIDEAPPVGDLLNGAVATGSRRALERVLHKSAAARYATASAFAYALLHGETAQSTTTEATASQTKESPTPTPAPSTTAHDENVTTASNNASPFVAADDADEGPYIEVEPEAATWQEVQQAAQPFIPLIEPEYVATTGAQPVDGEATDDARPARRRPERSQRQPLVPLAVLGAVSLLLTLVTVGRIVWTNFGEQMVDAALTPYAAAQASRLTPPQPPTMLTVPGFTNGGTSADTSFFAGALVRTTELLGQETLLADNEEPRVQTMSAAVDVDGTDVDDSVGSVQRTGSPPMVVVAPSSTPTDAPTDTPFPTETPVPSPTAIPSDTPTTAPTATPTETPLPSATSSPTATASATATTTATATTEPTVTATASATTTATPTSTATELASSATDLAGRIAYTRWDARSDRYELIFYSIERNESWPIVPNRRQPDFAPNGQLIASGDGGFIDNLVLMGTNGENPVPVSAHSEDAHPHWSPSGKQVVFDSTLVGDGRHRLYLHTSETFGQSLTPMMFEAWELFGRYPIFLGNGRIAYNGCDVWENASTCGIFQVTTDGSRPTNVTPWPGDIPTDNWGNQILAMSDRSGNWDVYRIDPTTGNAQQLTDSPGRDGLATASPDGNYIAFVSDRGGSWAVYTMRVDGSEERKLFELGGGFGSGDRDWRQERLTWGR